MRERWPVLVFALVMAAIPFVPGVPPFWIVLLDNIGLVRAGRAGPGAAHRRRRPHLVRAGGVLRLRRLHHRGPDDRLRRLAVAGAAGLADRQRLAAVLLGLVTVRLSGHYLPLGTIAWGLGLFYLFGKMEFLGRNDGISAIPPLSIGAFRMLDPGTIYYAIWIAVLISALLTMNLLDSRTGRAIRALRRGHVAAEAIGVQTSRTKLLVFIYAAVLAGLSGWLYAHFQRAANPTPFGAQAGIEYLFIAVVGGAGYVWGGVLGAGDRRHPEGSLQSYLPMLSAWRRPARDHRVRHPAGGAAAARADGVWPWLMSLLPFKPAARATDTGACIAARARAAAGDARRAAEIESARKQFGGLIAVNDVSFDVQAGEIVALIGPNGAGKSTTFNLITGVLRATGGSISRARQDDRQRAAAGDRELGISRTFQHVKLVPDMTVLENVALGAHLRGRCRRDRQHAAARSRRGGALLAEAARQIERVGLADQIDQLGRPLSLGQQRIVEIARALCADPMLLLLDEPAAGLRHMEKQRLAGAAAAAARRRHVGAAGRARHGIRDGPRRPHRGARVRHQDRRGHAGGDQDQSRRDQGLSRSRRMSALLSVADAHVAYGKVEAVRGVSLDVGDNEIVTIIGANGAGKTTLLNALMGMLPLKGRVDLCRRGSGAARDRGPRRAGPEPGAGASRAVRAP